MVYPNINCLYFCYWMLNISWQTLTPTRLALITAVYNASLNGTSVTTIQFNNFTQVTAWRRPYFQVWVDNNGSPPLESFQYFKYWSTQPSSTFKGYIDTFINTLKSTNDWQYLKAVWLLGVPTLDGAVINMCAPWVTQATLISTPTFTANQGYGGFSATKAINLQFTLGLGNTLNQNYAEFGAYSRTNSAEDGIDIGSANTASAQKNEIWAKWTDNKIYASIGGSAITGTTVSNSKQLFTIKRTNSANLQALQQGVSIVTTNSAPTGISLFSLYLGASNVANTITKPTTRQYALAYVADPQLNSLNFATAVQALGTSIGWQV